MVSAIGAERSWPSGTPAARSRPRPSPGRYCPILGAAARCLSGPGALVSVAQSLALDKPIYSGNPATGPLGRRLAQNTPTGLIQAPLLIAQGLADSLVLPSVQARYVAQRCAAGQKLDYLAYPGRNHVGLVTADSPLIAALTSWTQDRLTGKPAPKDCASM